MGFLSRRVKGSQRGFVKSPQESIPSQHSQVITAPQLSTHTKPDALPEADTRDTLVCSEDFANPFKFQGKLEHSREGIGLHK